MLESFKIQQEKFEGPLELLIHLIEKKKLHISDISLAQITDDYISYLEGSESTISQNIEFITTASTLLLIKSKSLLPGFVLTVEEEKSIEELEKRLTLYNLVKKHSNLIKPMIEKSSKWRAQRRKKDEMIVFAPDKRMDATGIKESIKEFITTLPKPKERISASLQPVIRLEDMITNLFDRISKSARMSFKSFSGEFPEKKNIIVSFLAVLELVKQQDIVVEQNGHYEDITCEVTSINTPTY
jgi:segregation and condensation protein A